MNAYNITELGFRRIHVAYVGSLDKVVDFIISCCGGSVATGQYKTDESALGRKSVNNYKRTKNEKGYYDYTEIPLTKKQIKDTIKNNKVCTFSGKCVGGYCFDTYEVEIITIE